MPRRIALSLSALGLSAMAAAAADLPAASRLGAIFAEPSDAGPSVSYAAPVIPYNSIPNPLWARGGYRYGSAFAYTDGPYYSGSYLPYAVRLPYACSFYGYC